MWFVGIYTVALLYSNSARACMLAKATMHRRDGSTICCANAMNATSGTGCAWTPAVRRLNVLYFDAERRCIFPECSVRPHRQTLMDLATRPAIRKNMRKQTRSHSGCVRCGGCHLHTCRGRWATSRVIAVLVVAGRSVRSRISGRRCTTGPTQPVPADAIARTRNTRV